jgi:hypothetical protein
MKSPETILGFVAGSLVLTLLLLAPRIWRGGSRDDPRHQLERVAVFEPPMFDFGEVLQAEVIRHEFRLINRTTNDVRLVGLRSSCNCAVVGQEMTGTTIPPKGFLSIPVDFHSNFDEGPTVSTVEAVTESRGARYYSKAHISGSINPDFTIEPRAVDFGTLAPGEEGTRTIRLGPRALKELEIVELRTTSDLFKVSLRNGQSGVSPPPHPEIVVSFVAPALSSGEVFGGTVEIKTSSKRNPEIGIPLRATVRPDLEIAPELIVLPRSGASGQSRFTIRTLQHSRITRILIMRHTGAQDNLPSVTPDNPDDGWNLTHVRQLANSSLAEAKAIIFELEVRNGIGRNEARSTSAQIKRL